MKNCDFLVVFIALIALQILAPHVGSTTTNVQARGPGLAGGTPRINNTFTLYFFGDSATSYNAANIHVWLSTMMSEQPLDLSLYSLPPTVSSNNDGTFMVTYGVLVYGKFYLHVEVNGAEIAHSPFRSEFACSSHPCGGRDCGFGLWHVNGSCICDRGYTMDACSIALGPTCYRAQITPQGTSLDLFFAPPVNISGLGTGCVEMFAGVTIAKLGVNPFCLWKHVGLFSVVFGSGATLIPGDSVVILTGQLIPYYSPSLIPEAITIVLVEPPQANTVIVPVGIVSAPAVHNPCADLVLDATSSYNSGGRPMTYTWEVHSNFGAVGAIQNFLGTVTTSIAVIPFKYTAQVGSNVDLVFTLNLTNYLGASDSVSLSVRVASTQMVDVRVTPAVVRVAAGTAVDIAGVASFPSAECTGVQVPSNIYFSWIRKSGPLLELDKSSNTPVLHISEGQLISGQVYEFEMLVSSGVASAVAVATVYVTEPEVVVHIIGGSRNFPLGAALSLQAEVLLNGKNANTAGRIVWSVVDTTTRTFILQGEGPMFGLVTVPASFFYPGVFQVVASLISVSSDLIASDTVEIHVTDSPETPIVAIKARAIIAAGEHLVLEAVVSPQESFTFQWTSEHIDLQDRDNVATSATSRVLLVPSASLASRGKILFSVTITSSSTLQIGWAQVWVTIGDAPTSGTCGLTPAAGIAFRDTFSLMCQGWESFANPLSFRVWRLAGNSTQIPLQLGYSPIAATSFILPAGSHTLLVDIADSTSNTASIYLHDVSVSFSTTDQSVLSQNPILLVNSLLGELQLYIDANNLELQIQVLPGIADILNFASAAANPASKTSAYLQRVLAREKLCNISLGLLEAAEPISGLVSYMLSQIGAYPPEISATTLAQLQRYVERISELDLPVDSGTLQSHISAVYAYVMAALESGVASDAIPLATNALKALSKASLATMFPTQEPYIFSYMDLQLCVAKGDSAWEWAAAGVRIPSSQSSWELSILSWPFSVYSRSRVSTAVYEVSYERSSDSTPVFADFVLPVVTGVEINNESVIECNVWNDTSISWTNSACIFMSSTKKDVTCHCLLNSPSTIVSAYVLQGNIAGIVSPTGSLDYVKFSTLSGYQWGIIVGVGMFAVVFLIGALVLAGKRFRRTSNFIVLKSYNEILRLNAEVQDVTIDNLSAIADDPSDPGSNYEDLAHSDDQLLSEAEELGKAPNVTRLSRMGVQEGAMGYVVSSTTLRNTLETDYDLERKENIGPIIGTALRIRALSISTEQNGAQTQTVSSNFSTAARVSLTAARAKLTAPSISRSTLGFTRGDSLRAIPTPGDLSAGKP